MGRSGNCLGPDFCYCAYLLVDYFHISGLIFCFHWPLLPHFWLRQSEVIPVRGRGGLQGCDMLRVPHYVDTRLTDDGEFVCFARRPESTPHKYFLVTISVRGSEAQGQVPAGRTR
jgi:hypothetical protein